MQQMSKSEHKLGRKLTREGSPSSMKTHSTTEANRARLFSSLLCRVRLLMLCAISGPSLTGALALTFLFSCRA